ncbi:MAG: PaaI family thioesterase [Agitococcus sp.]|nr:PaaI family thioesterase [Agitococcus sp.]
MSKLTAQTITTLIRDTVPSAENGQFTVLNVSTTTAECVFLYDASQLRFGGTLSGPTMMTLADAAMYAAVLAHYGEQLLAVTQDFSIHFLAKPAAADLQATATILKAGKRSVVLTVHLYSQQQLVAHASGTYALPRSA